MLARTPIEDIMFDKDTIIGFLESKDPNEKYNYCKPDRCAFAQFLTAHGTDPDEFYKNRTDKVAFSYRPPGVWHTIAFPPAGNEESTFGAALKRAKKLLK